VRIVYTPVSNLKKENGFEIGQVTFHSTKALRYASVPRRQNEIVNRLNKTKEERNVDFAAERLARQKEDTSRRRTDEAKAKLEALKEEQRRKEAAELQSYSTAMKKDRMTSNKHDEPVDIQAYEEDFFG